MRLLPVLAFAAGLLAMLRSAFPMEAGLDYFSDASAAIDALARGDITAFVNEAPLMGSFSLLLRAPFVRLVFDSSLDVVYFAGVLPCLAAVGALAARPSDRGRRRGMVVRRRAQPSERPG